ncbi:MAG: L-histidine N(alpha)-methyltransferase [Polyangiaceae bacterium]|nr:L-histidine N(alpha)-methyltransferase [Polyangiaceae bacterium]
MQADAALAEDVRRGLSAPAKSLPPHLFYDEEGSRLYELITELEEYYPTRTERAILERHAREIVALASDADLPLHVVELGAGSAHKTRLILSATVAAHGPSVYLPVDVSASALAVAAARLASELPEVRVRPFVGRHEDAVQTIAGLGPRRLVLFIGSSIGNFEDDDAVRLLCAVRRSLAPGDALLLGTDLKKSPKRLVPAYDDARGVTAAFNKNVLCRINRELDADFQLEHFSHVALWNEAASRIEMHLESQIAQEVRIGALELTVRFTRGERIHTESSIKYDLPRVDALLRRSGFAREESFDDDARLFSVHLARAQAL